MKCCDWSSDVCSSDLKDVGEDMLPQTEAHPGGSSTWHPDVIDAAGKIVKDAQGNSVKVPGRLKAVRAIGWYIEQYRQAQVSINLINYNTTPLHVVFETAREEAEKLGLIVTGSELVGLVPLKPMLDAGKFYLKKQGKSAGVPEKELVEIAIRSLGLDQLSDFDPAKKIVEYNFLKPAPLMSMTARDFVDEVSSESPAPGGGSVAALAGSLCAALLLSLRAQVLLTLHGDLASAFGVATGRHRLAFTVLLALVVAVSIKAVAMIVLGLLVGLIGTDVNSGVARFSFGMPELIDGVGIGAVAIYDPSESDVDNRVAASWSMLHDDTGLSLTVSGGLDTATSGGTPYNLYSKVGWDVSWLPFGATGFGVDYTYTENVTADGDQGESFGFAAVQVFERFGIELYSQLRWLSLDRALGPDFEDILVFTNGTRVRF
jgi:hypothetical protein